MAKEKTAADSAAHTPGVRKGEEMGRESGRQRTDYQGAGRPSGTSTPRDATSINPENRQPIDPESPYLLPA